MKLSTLLKHLTELHAQHGDVEVYIPADARIGDDDETIVHGVAECWAEDDKGDKLDHVLICDQETYLGLMSDDEDDEEPT